jgi:hypothetical protein
MVKGIQEGLKLNGTHQLTVHTYQVNLLGNNANSIMKNRKAQTDGSKMVCLVVTQKKIHTGKL